MASFDERLDAILPLVARYGAAVIGLPNNEEEIPEEPERRLELASKIIETATGKYGIPIEDVLIDPPARPTCRSGCPIGYRSVPPSCQRPAPPA